MSFGRFFAPPAGSIAALRLVSRLRTRRRRLASNNNSSKPDDLMSGRGRPSASRFTCCRTRPGELPRRLPRPALRRQHPQLSVVGETVTVGIRPEDLSVAAPGEAPFHGAAELVEALGESHRLHVQQDGAPVIVRLAGDPAVREAEIVHLDPDLSKVHRFTAAGLRLACSEAAQSENSRTPSAVQCLDALHSVFGKICATCPPSDHS